MIHVETKETGSGERGVLAHIKGSSEELLMEWVAVTQNIIQALNEDAEDEQVTVDILVDLYKELEGDLRDSCKEVA